MEPTTVKAGLAVSTPRRIAFTPRRRQKLHPVCSYSTSTSSASPKTRRHWLNCEFPHSASAKLFMPYYPRSRFTSPDQLWLSLRKRAQIHTTAIFCSQLFWERSLSSSVCKKQLFPMFTSNSIDSSSDYLTLPLGTLYRTIFDIDLYM